MLVLLSGLHGTVAWPVSACPSGLGEPLGRTCTMPNQNVGCSWKLSVPPLPSAWAGGRVLGQHQCQLTLLPEPGWFE